MSIRASRKSLAWLLACLIGGVTVSSALVTGSFAQAAQQLSASERAAAFVARMTPEEKAAQISAFYALPGERNGLANDANVRNTGQRVADEVARLDIHQHGGTAARPVRELNGFRRDTLKPDEMRILTFRLDPEDLRYWNVAARNWVNDRSAMEIAVGGSSAAPFQTSFQIVDKP